MKSSLALLGVLLAATLVAAEPPLVLITSTDTPPYSYEDEETGEIIGIEIDIARAAAAKLGRELVVRWEKFPDLLPKVNAGEADMAASTITITEGRRQAVDFSEPYAHEGGMLLYRAGERMPTMILAESLRIATIDSSTYDFYLSSHNIDPIRYDSYRTAVADLKQRKIDAVFFDSSAVRVLVSESGGELASSRMEFRENFAIALRKGNKALKDALDEVVRERNGR